MISTRRPCPRIACTAALTVALIVSLAWPSLARDDASDLFDRGRDQMAARDYAGARETLAAFTAKHPEAKQHAAAMILLGKASLYAKDFDAALRTFQRLLDGNADSSWAEKARLLMADAYTAQKRHALAADILKRRLETVEGREYKLMLARHYLAIAEDAEKERPGDGPVGTAQPVRNLAAAIVYLEKARALLIGEHEEAQLTVRIARAHFELGSTGKAIATLDRFFERFPDASDAPVVRILLARAHVAIGKTREARRHLAEFERDGGRYAGHARRQEALQVYAESWFAEGTARANDQGVAAARRAIAVDPGTDRATTLRYRIGAEHAGIGNVDAALEAFQAFRARHPKDARAADALFDIADLHIGSERFDDARQALQSFVAAYPNHESWAVAQGRIVDTLFKKAVHLAAGDDMNAAIGAYEAFLREYPAHRKSALAHFTIGALLEVEDRIAEALETYAITATRYAVTDPTNAARALYRKAQILREKREDHEAAIATLRQIITKFPNTSHRGKAAALLTRLASRELAVKTERAFTLDEDPTLNVRVRNVDRVRVRAYPIDLATYFLKKKRIGRIEDIEVRIIQPAVDWTEAFEGYARYKDMTRTLSLARLRKKAPGGGAFIVSLRGDDLECRTLVVLSDLTLVVKSAQKEALAFVVNESTGRPASGAAVTFTDGTRVLGTATTDANGVAKRAFKSAVGTVHVLATSGDHIAFGGGQNPSSHTFGYRPKAYLYTDRPRYRPGHTVHYKGILRRVSGGAYRTPKDVSVLVSVVDSRGAIVKQERVRTTDAGTISGSLRLGSAAPLGDYRLVAKLDRKSFESTFEVREYKKPEMFATVRAKRSDYVAGERVHATITGGYYFGGAVSAGAVEWAVYRAPFTFDRAGYREYAWFFEDAPETKRDSRTPGSLVARGTGTTDANGALSISFETGAEAGDWRYTVVAQVKGRGRTTAFVRTPLFVTERAFYALVKADKKAYQPKEAIRVNVTTVDARHTPVARSGRVDLVRLHTTTTGSVAKIVEATAPVGTGEDGRGDVVLRAPRGGRYAVRFVGEDRRNEAVTDEVTIDVAGEAEDLAKQARIVAEREIYYTGDVARVMVNTPKAPAWALVTFEGERVIEHRVVHLERRSTMLELPIRSEHSPNVFLRVAIPADHALHEDQDEVLVFKFLAMRITTDATSCRPGDTVRYAVEATDPKGRPVRTELSFAVVDESLLAIAPDANRAIKPFFYDQKRTLGVRTSSSTAFEYVARTERIDPALLGMEARRRIETAHKDVADAVGEAQKIALDRAFKPGALVASPDPTRAESRSRFKAGTESKAARAYRKNKAPHSGSESSAFFLGRSDSNADKKSADAIGAFAFDDEDGDDRAPLDAERLDGVVARQRFVDTAAWRPHVVTDENGRATIEITLPDNLTTWRAKAVGVGGDTLVGSAETRLRVSKPLVAKLDVPRFLTQGDRARVSGVLHDNTGRGGRHAAKLDVEGASLASPATRTAAIDATGAVRVDWDLDAPAARPVTFTLKATGPDVEDGMQRTIPSHPLGIRSRVARSGSTTESTTLALDLPGARIVGAERFVLRLSPGYDAVMLDALDYVGTFPYGCLEQTVSRFLPAVACADALRALGIDDPARRTALTERVEAGLARLYHLQRSDGGWGWWHAPIRGRSPVGGSGARMTAYALLGLEVAQRAGFVVDQRVLARARAHAKQAATRAAGYDVRAMLLHALSINRAVTVRDLNRVHRYRDLLTPAGLARLALAYHRLGSASHAETLVDMLVKRAVKKDGVAHWACHGKHRGGWDRSTVESTAWAVTALLATRPDDPLVDAAIDYLMRHRQGRAFGTTKDTSAALLAFARYAVARGAARADYTLRVVVNDRVAHTARVTGGTVEGANRTIALDPESFRAGTNVVRLEKDGPGRFHYAFLAEYHTPAERIPAAGSTLRVRRGFRLRPRPSMEDKPAIRPGWSVVIPEFRPKRTSEPKLARVQTGDLVDVSVTLEPKEALRFVMLEDPLPAGFEVVRDSASGSFDRFERRDDRAVFFFSALAKSMTVSYRLRAVHPGAYCARPSFAAPMYEPEIWGRANSEVIEIHESVAAAPGRKKQDPTPDELYYGGLADFAAGRKAEARTKLRGVLTHRLRDEFRDEVLSRLVRLDLDHDPKAAVTAFEELIDRNPKKASFERPTRVGLAMAYHRVEEFERAAASYRDLLDESFEHEGEIVRTYQNRNDPVRAQRVLASILRRYPDRNAVITASYRRSIAFASIPDRRRDLGGAAALAKIAAPTMKGEAIRELKAFTGFYPESPLADDAHHEIIKLFNSLTLHDHVTAEASRFGARYPKSPWLDDVLHLAMKALYEAGDYDAALRVAKRLIDERFASDSSTRTRSPWRFEAIYLFGKIHHVRGNLAEAVRNYRKVAGRFSDARDAVAYLTGTSLEAPATVAVTAGEEPTIRLTAKNLTQVSARVYPVDLEILFALRKNLRNVNAIDLTGIPAVATIQQSFDRPPAYTRFEHDLKLPMRETGVYLVVAKAGDLEATSIVLVSELRLTVQRAKRTVRIYVTKRADGAPVAGATVRIADGRRIVAEGKTDPRGIYEGPAVRGAVSIVVREKQTGDEPARSFALHQER